MTIEKIAITGIKPNPWNPRRQTEREFKALCLSLKERGQLMPIRVREVTKGYEIIGGYHTYKALKQNGEKEIYIINEGKLSDNDAKIRSLQDNVHGADLPLEWAQVIVDLTKSGMTLPQIAERVGKPKIELEDAMKLIPLDQPAKDLAEAVGAAHYIELTFILDEDIKGTMDRIVSEVTSVLTRNGATLDSVTSKLNPARESVNVFGISVTEPQREIVERAITQVMEQEECTRGRALEMVAADYLAGANQTGEEVSSMAKKKPAKKKKAKKGY